jgi:nucleoside-diphosphate-sugar epimerase
MKVFVAGATGAIGKQLVPLVAAAGRALKTEDDPLDPSPPREMRETRLVRS